VFIYSYYSLLSNYFIYQKAIIDLKMKLRETIVNSNIYTVKILEKLELNKNKIS